MLEACATCRLYLCEAHGQCSQVLPISSPVPALFSLGWRVPLPAALVAAP